MNNTEESPSAAFARMGDAFLKGINIGLYSFYPLDYVKVTVPWILFKKKPKPVLTLKDMLKKLSMEVTE